MNATSDGTRYRPSEELWELVAAHCDDLLTEPQRDRLEDLLSQDQEAKRFCAAYLDLHAAILWRYRESAVVPDELPIPDTAIPASLIMPPATRAARTVPAAAMPRMPVLGSLGSAFYSLVRPAVWMFALCGGVYVAYVFFITWGMLDRGERGARLEARGARDEARGARDEARGASSLQPSDLAPHASHLAPASAVATVTGTSDAEWADPANKSEIRNQKSEIVPGEPLDLASGVVQLKLKQGVTLRIEGPAEWTIDGNNRATLKRGKLIASVPHRAIGFTLLVPNSTIVDLGTEFGVEVDEQGHTDTVVFRGKVEVITGNARTVTTAEASPSVSVSTTHRLVAGEALRIDALGNVTSLAAPITDPDQFIAVPTNSVDAEEPPGLTPQSRRYRRLLLEQTGPIAYWDLSNLGDIAQSPLDHAMRQRFSPWAPAGVSPTGPSGEQGFPGFQSDNLALRFACHHRVGLVPQATVAPVSYSVQVWFNAAEDFANQAQSYLFARSNRSDCPYLRDGLLVGGFHYSATRRPESVGKLAFYDGVLENDHLVGETQLQPGRWYCATLVRDRSQIWVYLNGTLEFTGKARWQGGDGMQFVFGHRNLDVSDRYEMGWNGLLDEIAVWNYPLSASDIAALYARAAHPHETESPNQRELPVSP